MVDGIPKTLAFSFLSILLASTPTALAADKEPPVTGWYDVFPKFMMAARYSVPEIAKGKDGETTYSQSAHYDFATGLQRSFRVTIARDPEFKKKFNSEALKGIAADTQLEKRTVWTWLDKRQVAVVLAEDKAVVIALDRNSVELPLSNYVKQFDFDRIEKALAKPPRTERELTSEMFEIVPKGTSARAFREWCGYGKLESINKEKQHNRSTYALKDGSTVVAVTLGDKLESLTRQTADGKRIDYFSKPSPDPAPAPKD